MASENNPLEMLETQNDTIEVENDANEVQNDAIEVQNDASEVQNDAIEVQQNRPTPIRCLQTIDVPDRVIKKLVIKNHGSKRRSDGEEKKTKMSKNC